MQKQLTRYVWHFPLPFVAPIVRRRRELTAGLGKPQFTLAAIQSLWSLWRTPRQLYRRIMMCYVSCIYSNISTCLLGQHFYFFTCDIKSAWMCSLFQSISRECSLNVWMWAKHITLKNTVLIVRRSRVDKRQTIFKNNMFSFPQTG